MKILGIESSCDETACSVVEDGKTVLSNVVASQIDEHKLYGGEHLPGDKEGSRRRRLYS